MIKLSKKLLSILTIVGICTISTIPIGLLIWKESSSNSGFVLANYQSYIDNVGTEDDPTTPEDETIISVETHLKDKYGVSYDYFETAESAKNLLVKNTADIVNSTTYEVVNWVKDERKIVHKLDWTKFKIEGVTNANEALNLFIPQIQSVLTAYDIDGDGQNDNLLDYGIPYFLQDYVFAYRGQKINEFEDPNITWNKFFDLMTTNETIKKRFITETNPKIFAVEDSRSFFTIANNIHKEKNSITTDIKESEEFSNDYLLDRYLELAKNFNDISSRAIAFNGDANVTVNKLARWEVEGGFCYNGDALYAYYGGDDEIVHDPDTFHIVKPKDSIAALDMFVINNRLTGEKLQKAYDVLAELCLGSYYDENNQLVSINSPSWDPSLNWTYRNFNFVNYTVPLKKVYDDVVNTYFEGETDKKIFTVNVQGANNYEKPISDVSKSNISFQWIGFKTALD